MYTVFGSGWLVLTYWIRARPCNYVLVCRTNTWCEGGPKILIVNLCYFLWDQVGVVQCFYLLPTVSRCVLYMQYVLDIIWYCHNMQHDLYSCSLDNMTTERFRELLLLLLSQHATTARLYFDSSFFGCVPTHSLSIFLILWWKRRYNVISSFSFYL